MILDWIYARYYAVLDYFAELLGKYAAEVLLAYGISLALLALMVGLIRRKSRLAKKALEAAENG